MLKMRMKSTNGKESAFIGLTPHDLAELVSNGICFIEGQTLGLGDDKAVVLVFGESPQAMLAMLEENLPWVKFPKDDKGNYLQVNA